MKKILLIVFLVVLSLGCVRVPPPHASLNGTSNITDTTLSEAQVDAYADNNNYIDEDDGIITTPANKVLITEDVYIEKSGLTVIKINSTDANDVAIEFIRNGNTKTDWRLIDDGGSFYIQSSTNDGASWSSQFRLTTNTNYNYNNVHVADTTTGSNSGTDICIDANDELCQCGQCA